MTVSGRFLGEGFQLQLSFSFHDRAVLVAELVASLMPGARQAGVLDEVGALPPPTSRPPPRAAVVSSSAPSLAPTIEAPLQPEPPPPPEPEPLPTPIKPPPGGRLEPIAFERDNRD